MLDVLGTPQRKGNKRVPKGEPCRVTLDEIRLRLNVIRAEEEGRYQRARVERQHLQHVERPPSLDEALATERQRVQERTATATRYTDAERVRLEQLAKEKRSWNPFTRRTAATEENRLLDEQRSRYEKALAGAICEFEQRDLPQLEKRMGARQRDYRQYVDASLGLEREINDARATRDRIPKVEQQVTTLERAGVSHIDCDAVLGAARLEDLAAAVDHQYRALPVAIRRDVEYSIRKELRARDSRSIDR